MKRVMLTIENLLYERLEYWRKRFYMKNIQYFINYILIEYLQYKIKDETIIADQKTDYLSSVKEYLKK